jgi:hypothetical protein
MFCAHRLKLALMTTSITNRMRETRAEKDGKADAETTAGRMEAPQNLAKIAFCSFRRDSIWGRRVLGKDPA